MPRIPGYLTPHQLTFTPKLGDGAKGPILGEPVTVRCYAEDKTRLVFVGGQQVPSSTRVWVDIDTAVTLNSDVTVVMPMRDGTVRERTAPVIAIAVFDHPGAVSHLQLDLA